MISAGTPLLAQDTWAGSGGPGPVPAVPMGALPAPALRLLWQGTALPRGGRSIGLRARPWGWVNTRRELRTVLSGWLQPHSQEPPATRIFFSLFWPEP